MQRWPWVEGLALQEKGSTEAIDDALECAGRACGLPIEMKVIGFVTPAQAGVHVPTNWIPAFAGMT
jgi:hypothetical protein